MIAVADTDSAGVTPDLRCEKEKAQARRRQRGVLTDDLFGPGYLGGQPGGYQELVSIAGGVHCDPEAEVVSRLPFPSTDSIAQSRARLSANNCSLARLSASNCSLKFTTISSTRVRNAGRCFQRSIVFSETPTRWAISRIGMLPSATNEAAVSFDGFHCQRPPAIPLSRPGAATSVSSRLTERPWPGSRLDESRPVSAVPSSTAAGGGEPRSASGEFLGSSGSRKLSRRSSLPLK